MGWAGVTGGAHRQACPSYPISPGPRSCPASFQQAQLSFAEQERRVLAWERAGAERWARKGGFGSQRVPRSRAHAHVGGSADGSAGQHRPWRFCFPAANVPTSMGRKEKQEFASAPGLDKAVKSGGSPGLKVGHGHFLVVLLRLLKPVIVFHTQTASRLHASTHNSPGLS